MNKTSKGFTIIELLVVIAIIAVLAAIVLVNVTQYIAKGKDAAAQGNLSTILTNGAVFYDSTTLGNSTYSAFIGTAASPITTVANCAAGANAGSGFIAPCQALINAGYNVPGVTVTCAGTSCATGTTGWCAMVTLKAGGNTYCVDSTGNKINKASGSCAAGLCS